MRYRVIIMRSSGENRSTRLTWHGARATCLIWQVPVDGTQFTYTGMPVRLVAPVHRWCALWSTLMIAIETYADYYRNSRWLQSKLMLVPIENFAAPRSQIRSLVVAIPSSRRISRRYVPQVHARPPADRAPRRIEVGPRLHALVPRVRYVLVISASLHGHQRKFEVGPRLHALVPRVWYVLVISASLHGHQHKFAYSPAQVCMVISASLHRAGTLKWRLLVANDRDELDRQLRRHCDTSRCAISASLHGL